jgi:Protein of unknown function (DUF402)
MVDDEVPLPPRSEPPPFDRGTPVVLRSVRDHGHPHGVAVGFAVAGTVVLDTDDVVAVCTRPGSGLRTRAGRGSGPSGRIVLPATWDGRHNNLVWEGQTVVRVHRRGDRWSVWRWHDGARWTDDWYGNLESPWRRSPIGFDTQDWALDVVGTGHPVEGPWAVRYKDDDELTWRVDRGALSAAHAAHIRKFGAKLMQRAQEALWPFNADWDAWLPDPDWTAVPMPEGWRQLHL